ncbi:hypothetical protein H8356DRAFT_1329376 [Neocallimastix lanati (nom. inval.)]|nr:hypothetical protein H8356DRAFT_1329376 [Neocallimastix sp. JGI-2020a]
MTNLIEDLSKDYNNEDDAVLNCVINNYTNANIHEQHNNLTCCASLPISKFTEYLNNIKHCNKYIRLPNGKTVLSTTQSTFTDFLFNYKIVLSNVYYDPYINRNIISVTNLIKQNFKIIFYNNQRSCKLLRLSNKKSHNNPKRIFETNPYEFRWSSY